MGEAPVMEMLGEPGGNPRGAVRTAIVVAHPDDEVVGAGGRLWRLRDAIFIHVTDGAPLDGRDARAWGFADRREYALVRRRELYQALSLAGIGPGQARELGCPDQQASLYLEELARSLAALVRRLRPGVVLTHPYEGGHPDHDATAFAVHAACQMLREGGAEAPAIVEMTSYHLGPAGIEPGTFLPVDGCEVVTLGLSDDEREMKRRMFECYETQKETLKYFPIDVERFRPAPRYDFTEPPHAGRLFYEMHPWGMEGRRFRGLAREAMRALRIGGRI